MKITVQEDTSYFCIAATKLPERITQGLYLDPQLQRIQGRITGLCFGAHNVVELRRIVSVCHRSWKTGSRKRERKNLGTKYLQMSQTENLVHHTSFGGLAVSSSITLKVNGSTFLNRRHKHEMWIENMICLCAIWKKKTTKNFIPKDTNRLKMLECVDTNEFLMPMK